ncbi:MAG: N-acetylmuramoyl-L-alanine amidase [bacterium]
MILFVHFLPEKRGQKQIIKTDISTEQKITENKIVANISDAKEKEPINKKVITDSYPTIVVDPTHGGDDLGNVGVNSVVESHINLQVAFKLARALRMKGIKVFLTRMDDYNVALDKKFKDAEKHDPILFLSINCAYSDKKGLRGAEIYGFTPEAVNTELETNSNKSYEFYEGVYVPKTQEAMLLENKVSSSIKKELDLPYKSRLERRFLKVLALSAGLPTIAVFVGYISNNDDAKFLSSEKQIDEWTEKLAKAIESGITKKEIL